MWRSHHADRYFPVKLFGLGSVGESFEFYCALHRLVLSCPNTTRNLYLRMSISCQFRHSSRLTRARALRMVSTSNIIICNNYNSVLYSKFHHHFREFFFLYSCLNSGSVIMVAEGSRQQNPSQLLYWPLYSTVVDSGI